MPLLSTDDLIKKSKDKGFTKKAEPPPPSEKDEEDFFSPWQQNSLLNDKKVIPFSPIKLDNQQDINRDNKIELAVDTELDNKQEYSRDNCTVIKSDIYSDNKSDNKKEAIEITSSKQSDNIKITSREQQDTKQDNNAITSREQIREYPGVKLDINQDIEQDNKILRHHLISLSGVQKSLFDYVLDEATYNDGFITGFICTRVMASEINCTYDTAKMTLNRLIQKGILIRHKGKGCRGGYIILEISKNVKTLYLESRRGTKRDTQRDNKPEISQNHYSNSNKITTIIGDGWDEIDISPLEHIGFKKTQLLQLKNVNAPDIVQESVNHFAFGLEHNPKFKSYETPLIVLMGVLKKGQGWIEPNYISPIERARKQFAEARRAEQERLAKMEKEEFNRWESTLTEAEKKQFAPAKFPPAAVQLQAYFKEYVWPNLINS